MLAAVGCDVTGSEVKFHNKMFEFSNPAQSVVTSGAKAPQQSLENELRVADVFMRVIIINCQLIGLLKQGPSHLTFGGVEVARNLLFIIHNVDVE